MAGLLGLYQDPAQAGMLGLAGGLLQAGGPSRMPVSFGQALGGGLLQGAQMQEAARKAQLSANYINAQTTGLNLANLFTQERLKGLGEPIPGEDGTVTTPVQPPPVQPSPMAPGGSSVMAPPAGSPAPIYQPQPSSQPAASAAQDPMKMYYYFANQARVGVPGAAQQAVAWLSRTSPTDFQKLEAAAKAGDPLAAQQLKKLNYIAPVQARQGSALLDPLTGLPSFYNPKVAEGSAPIWNPGGMPVGNYQIPGGQEAIGAAEYPRAAARAAVTPIQGVSGGSPVFISQLKAAGAPGVPGVPGTGSQPAAIPGGIPGGIPSAPVRPAFPPGYVAAKDVAAKAGAERYNSTVALASESPMRINVLDNIISLSQDGVATGNGAEWQNKVLGYAANTPLLGNLLSKQKDNVGKFQELQKFTYQNALRNWQAAGGTGTDAQMAAASHANPNDTLFPKALQQIADWGKASELALQSKARAQDLWLKGVNGDYSQQNQFESDWREHFDPKIYQLQLMNPTDGKSFIDKLSSADRNKLIKDANYARSKGWLQ